MARAPKGRQPIYLDRLGLIIGSQAVDNGEWEHEDQRSEEDKCGMLPERRALSVCAVRERYSQCRHPIDHERQG